VNRFFDMAIMLVIGSLFINGAIVALGPSLFNTGEGGRFDNLMAQLPDTRISDENVAGIGRLSEDTVKDSGPVDQLIIFVSAVVGTVENTFGGVAFILASLFSFGVAYSVMLEFIFGDIPVLWTFMVWVVIPFINLIQVISITYLLIYVISALRGGSA